MAAMSEMPQLEEEKIVRMACSDPLFITEIYHIIAFSEIESKIPECTITVLGGAAFIMHAYMMNDRNIQVMQESIHTVPQTSDIDIAIWYKDFIDKDTFSSGNKRMVHMIGDMLNRNKKMFSKLLVKRLIELLPEPSVIRTLKIDVAEEKVHKNYEHMTSKISINFIINGKSFKVVDIAIKNAIYSQGVRPGTNRRSISVYQNVTHMDERNTIRLKVKDGDLQQGIEPEYVRVPTIGRLIQQQKYAIDMKSAEGDQFNEIPKYKARISYLAGHVPLDFDATLDALRPRLARAIQDTNAMRAALPAPPPLSRPASLSRNSGRPPLAPRRGGKRRTHRKNKHHKKRRHTKRN
jgi:hypothetical protein